MDRYRIIEKFAKQHNWKQGLELGVWVGVTTFWLMKNTDVNMTCIDAWEVQDDNPEYDWQYNKKPVKIDQRLDFLKFWGGGSRKPQEKQNNKKGKIQYEGS